MIDNWELIKPLLKFDNEEEFYFLQIIQRKKDFEKGQQRFGRDNNNRLIKAYYIYSLEQLDRYKGEIVMLCNDFNARAGINLNRRNQKDIALKCLEILAISLRKNEFSGISKIYNSACGKESSNDKTWVIDLDKEDLPKLDNIVFEIEKLKPILELGESKIIAQIPSKSGLHLITRRFDRQSFSKEYPLIECHVNNPTNLYIP